MTQRAYRRGKRSPWDSDALFPITGFATGVHHGHDLNLVALNPEHQHVWEDLKTALPQFTFETAVNFRIRHNPRGCRLPRVQKPVPQIYVLLTIPESGFGSIFIPPSS